jgi:hypothetical protein
MKRLVWIAAACLFLAATAWGDQQADKPRGRYLSPTYGFAIESPDFDALPDGHAQTTALFYGPPDDGFSPNVNIRVVQANAGATLEDYAQASIAGLEKTGLKIVTQKASKVDDHDALLLEAAGNTSGRPTHLLSYSVFGSDRFIVITCTATQKQFDSLRDRFTACLDSFRWESATAGPGDKPHGGYRDSTYGFELRPPVFDLLAAGKMQDIATFCAPAVDGFSPTVAIRILQVNLSASRAAYTKSAVRAIEQIGAKVSQQKAGKVQGRDTLLLDAGGTVKGRNMHFLQYSVLDSDRVIIVTCSATEQQFADLQDRLTACLKSFVFTGANP